MAPAPSPRFELGAGLFFRAMDLQAQPAQKEQEVALLYRINDTVTTSLNLAEVLDETIKIVGDLTDADASLIYLLDRPNRELTLVASQSPHPELLGNIKLSMGEGITGWVAQEEKPVVLEKEASQDPRFKLFHNLPEDQFEAFASFPITFQGRVVGVINVLHQESHPYGEEALKLLGVLSQQVGGAIEKAGLYDRFSRKYEEIQVIGKIASSITNNGVLDHILSLVASLTSEVMHSRLCSIMVLEEDQETLTVASTQSLDPEYIQKPPVKVKDSLCGIAVQEKRVVQFPDIHKEPRYYYPDLAKRMGLKSLLCVPMVVKGQVKGVINTYAREPHRFSQDEIQLLETIAAQAAVAIDNAELKQKEKDACYNLEVRKIVERAKGILMDKKGMSEKEAYRFIQKNSMDSHRPILDIAEFVIFNEEMRFF